MRALPGRADRLHAGLGLGEELLAIDLGKRWFHLYGIDTDGVILSQKVSRAKLAEVVMKLVSQQVSTLSS